MKKQAIILAVASAVVMPAMAQNSVTTYGVADTGVAYYSNQGGGSATAVRSGNLQTSRLGFRGNEDLGGGLSAVFNLEMGIVMDTGATSSATQLWNRQSWVGIASTTAGRLTLGVQTSPVYDLYPYMSQEYFGAAGAGIDGGAGPAGSSIARFNNTIGGTRFSNTIKYVSPTAAGFRVSAMIAPGEVAGSSSAGRLLSAGFGYRNGPIDAGVGYLVTACVEATGCPVNKDDDKVTAIGAAYNFGRAKVGAIFTKETNAKNVRGNDANVTDVILNMPVDAWDFTAGYQHLNDKSGLNQDATQYNFAALYYLSKRTTLYGILSKQTVKNGGKAGFFSVLSSDDKLHQLSLGIRHKF